MSREMGEPFYGTGKAPDGYKPGDYVEHGALPLPGEWIELYVPSWSPNYQYRLEASHPYYMPPLWCLDRAAQSAGYADWGVAGWAAQLPCRNSIIAHARTLQNGCEPMREPVDPLVEALMGGAASSMVSGIAHFMRCADNLRARFDITEKSK